MEKQEIESILNRIHDWIKSADQKVSIFLGFQGVILAVLLQKTINTPTLFIRDYLNLPVVFLYIGTFVLLYSLYKSIMALFPRLKKDSNTKSISYFGDIAKLELNDYRKDVNATSDENYIDDLISQIHISSKIADKKHRYFAEAIILFTIAIVILSFSFLFVII